MKPTQAEIEKYATQMRLEHNRRIAAAMKRGLTGRALDTVIRASEAKRDRAIRKFSDGGDSQHGREKTAGSGA